MSAFRLISPRWWKNHYYKRRTKDILHLRFVEGWTLQAIGDKYGISRQRVDQIVQASRKGQDASRTSS